MNPLSPSGPARWERLGQTTQAKTRVLDLLSVRYRHPVRGTEKEFAVIQPTDWCNVLALTPQGELVLVRQFRFGIDTFSLEIPGGMMDAGEDPLAAAARELREETGFVGTPGKLIGSTHPNPAIQTNRCHYVLIENAVRATEQEWDADEEIEVTVVPADEVIAQARAGAITHALVLNALFLFEPHWATWKRMGRAPRSGQYDKF